MSFEGQPKAIKIGQILLRQLKNLRKDIMAAINVGNSKLRFSGKKKKESEYIGGSKVVFQFIWKMIQ